MRKGEYNKEVLRLQQLLGRKLRLHAESELQIQLSAEREKVLCDLLLHQEFFEHISAALAKHVRADPATSAAVGSDSGTTLQGLWQAGAAADVSTTETHPTQPNHPLPDSYIARLLRQISLQELQRVLQMTPQDWVDFWNDTTQQLLLLLEICSRSEYDYDLSSEAAAASGSPSSCGEDVVLATASSEGSSAAGSAAQQQRWSLREQPLHTSAAANRKQLWQTVDSRMRLCQLAWLMNPAPFLSSADVCLIDGKQGRPGPEHWEAVVTRLQLSPMQEAYWSICITELKRMQEANRSEGINLLQSAQQPSLQVAAALQQQQQQQPMCRDGRASRARSRTAQGVQQAGPDEGTTAQQRASALQPSDATEPTVFCQTPVAQQFQSHVAKRRMQLWCVQAFILSTLTRHQLAVFTVACFPYVPATYTVAEVVCTRLQQRTQQQLREVEKGVNMKSSAALRKAFSGGKTGARKRNGAAVDDHGSGQGPERVPFSQWLRQQHDQERAAELLLHQRHCWSQLDRLQHLE